MHKHYYILIKSVICFTLMVTKHTNIFYQLWGLVSLFPHLGNISEQQSYILEPRLNMVSYEIFKKINIIASIDPDLKPTFPHSRAHRFLNKLVYNESPNLNFHLNLVFRKKFVLLYWNLLKWWMLKALRHIPLN